MWLSFDKMSLVKVVKKKQSKDTYFRVFINCYNLSYFSYDLSYLNFKY